MATGAGPRCCSTATTCSRADHRIREPAGARQLLLLPPRRHRDRRPARDHHAGLAATRFAKLRLCPWTLLAKTDDVTFAMTDMARCATTAGTARATRASTVCRSRRRATCAGTPASPACSNAPARCAARQDQSARHRLRRRHQLLCVDTAPRAASYCSPPSGTPSAARSGAPRRRTNRPTPGRTRCSSEAAAGAGVPFDTTVDELAAGGNFDHEGRNGGWVLVAARRRSAQRHPHSRRRPCRVAT